MKKPVCFVTEIDIELGPKLREDLINQGFEIYTPPYTLVQGKKKGVSCTLYQSGKLTVQGKDKDDFIAYYLEPEILKKLSYSYPETEIDFTPRIGVDEAGKGDLFGPLCICALYADKEGIDGLIKLGIKDSKKLGDPTILKLSKQIKKNYAYSLIQIFPKKYNELYEKFQNLNHLLAWGHATSIQEVVNKTQCKEVIIDQFAHERVVETALKKKDLEIQLTQRHKGEEDIIVAAASILARAAFVEGIDQLGKEYGLILPKGASKAVITAGRKFISLNGEKDLDKVAKIHFKTAKEILIN